MPRRPPSDTFTRFTSTTPHAMQRPATTATFQYQPASRPAADRQPSPSSSSFQSPGHSRGPPGETPLERVERLRAEARAAKEAANYSPIEQLIGAGRRWADRAHRFTAYGLILFAGLSTVVAAYGTVSLVAHNRRQKRAWIERELDRLDEARAAFLRGEANAEQLHLLEQERAGEEIERQRMREVERKRSESYWSKFKGMVGAQTAKGDMGVETEEERQQREARKMRRQKMKEEGWIEGEVQAVAVAPSGIKGVGVDSKGRPVPANTVEYVVNKVEGERRTGEKEVTARSGITGGPLDVMADNVKEAVTPSTESRGWLSWIRGSKS
ncbi:uncharacterized protein Z518_08291 [Rhinocladiella mackenziei CBS 650.93]|uniref:Uncharacterized protein n=1 Tax=Rhinocladiella mackenziei CBS 650.93 TaxID=1442369 RepID=A0A0D2J0D2_9EURO|nr:uncharacterized protein Z518_08291 [Rhinocladiella mackenziei CBS 650.93]KIX02350.1 hypothetical protein Z518_08291 [Rhinocladiella mackenziei CBS 650.93]